MKPAFTPGPWVPNKYRVYGPDTRVVAYARGLNNKERTPEDEANARLIAAAPELLDDAKKLVNEVSGMMGAPELRALVGNTNFAVLQERWEKMRETIDKAEGWEA